MTSKVRKANKLTSGELYQLLDTDYMQHPNFSTEARLAQELSDDEKNEVFDIFSHNIRHIYEDSSFGWDPPSKRSEMFDPLSRFILARGLSKSIDPAAFSCTPVVAYAMFRFDREAKQNVVYCYELQVSVAARRLRLGQHLMKQLERIGRGTGMSKVMLTVQKANVVADRFYERIGFTTDPTSPNYHSDGDDGWENESAEEEAESDYHILSKLIST